MADQRKQGLECACVVEEEGGKSMKPERHQGEEENVDMAKQREI